jgi:hypothetical protein
MVNFDIFNIINMDFYRIEDMMMILVFVIFNNYILLMGFSFCLLVILSFIYDNSFYWVVFTMVIRVSFVLLLIVLLIWVFIVMVAILAFLGGLILVRY